MTQFRLEAFATLPRWVQAVLIFSVAAVLGAVAGLLRNEIVNLLNTL
jgi:tetrahydromethanopterin S-methyltransferase subunit C